MRRHVIIGRFGTEDRTSVPTAKGEIESRLEFVAPNNRLQHGIGDALHDLASLGIYPSEMGVDLFVIAAHVHAADTRISRRTESQDAWTRELRLVVPVSDVARWSNAALLLQRLLNFLTGDRWTIGFRQRPRGFTELVLPTEQPQNALAYDTLALFSGGLDSLIGAIDVLEAGATPLFISHAGDGPTSDAQKKLMDSLKRHYSQRSPGWLRIWINFPHDLVRDVASENTTRGRSFLFFSAGVLAGTGLPGTFTLRVPENGLISLNVPLDPLRLGALSTRTTHPFYMARWNDLLVALGIPGCVENPYWKETKGEMVAGCAKRDLLADLAPVSLSCASPAKSRWLGHGPEHCGHCLPCLIRRAALHHGLGSDPTRYTLDVTSRTLDALKAEGQQVRSFQYALERLRQKPQLATYLIHKPGPLSDESPSRQTELAGVYQRGLEELGRLLARVHTEPG
jgi:hypothetical protein